MLATNPQHIVEPTDTAKLEFYRLIGEGYTIDEVREKLKNRRDERG